MEVEQNLTRDLGWQTGRNLDAFNDVLRGGFGVTEYEEPFLLIWHNSEKSRKDLSRAESGEPDFDVIIRLIESHQHITLELR